MLIGNIAEFSLPELLKMMGEGKKTGLLSLTCNSKSSANSHIKEVNNYYIWFKKGEIISASNCLDGKGLISLISRRSWVDKDKILYTLMSSKSLKTPLGNHLKSQELIQDKELEVLFRMQVSRQVMPLFEVKKASFKFYENVSAPFTELTGLSIGYEDLILKSLRVLRDWSVLKDKLPSCHSILGNICKDKAKLHLDEWEKQVWELATQNFPLNKIAHKLKINVDKVKQIAFRLISIGLLEEIPMNINSNNIVNFDLESKQNVNSSENAFISPFYFNKLVSFLKQSESSPLSA